MAAPGLVKAYKKYKDRGVAFIGLTAEGEDAKKESQAFVDEFAMTWPNGYGAQSTIDALGVSGYPTVFVIGADGKVAWNDELGGELEAAIDDSLAALSAAPQ